MRKINRLVIHHSAGPQTQTVEEIKQEHLRRGYIDIGYHKIILPSGEIKQGRSDTQKGAHCYSAEHKSSHDVNATSLGICVIGNFQEIKINPKQWNGLVICCTILCRRHGIEATEIYGHRDFMPTACPGKNLYKQMLGLREEVYKRLHPEPAGGLM